LRWSFVLCLIVIAILVSIPNALDQGEQNWAISGALEHSMIKFNYDGLSQGNISNIEVTPKGRLVSSYYSHVANINLENIKLIERTSAFQGAYKSEDFIKLELDKALIKDAFIYSPFFVLNIKGTITVSSWDARRNIEYSGKGINDRDYSFNDFNQYGKYANAALFYDNMDFSKERSFKSPGEFSIKAKATGRAELKSNYGLKDTFLVKNEFYNGKFNISMNNKYGFGSVGVVNDANCSDWLGGLCKIPCWNREYENVIFIPPGSIYTTKENYYLNYTI
jgi:hypothetical protein